MLVDLLKKDDYTIYMTAARVLGELKAYISLDLVQRLFASSHDEKAQIHSGVRNALQILENHLPSHWLIEAMTHEHWQWRKTAAYTMSLRKEPIFVRPLINALNDSQWQVRVAAAQALAEINEPSATEPLINALNDPQSQVRVAAAQALAEIDGPLATEPLFTALHDEDWRIRLAVATTLATFAIPFSLTPVIEALTRPDVAPYLGSQPLPTTTDEERETRHLMARMLDKVGPSLPREMLLSTALQSEDWRIRKAAIESLIKHDGSIPWEVLFKMMDQEGGGSWAAREVLSTQPQKKDSEFMLLGLQEVELGTLP